MFKRLFVLLIGGFLFPLTLQAGKSEIVKELSAKHYREMIELFYLNTGILNPATITTQWTDFVNQWYTENFEFYVNGSGTHRTSRADYLNTFALPLVLPAPSLPLLTLESHTCENDSWVVCKNTTIQNGQMKKKWYARCYDSVNAYLNNTVLKGENQKVLVWVENGDDFVIDKLGLNGGFLWPATDQGNINAHTAPRVAFNEDSCEFVVPFFPTTSQQNTTYNIDELNESEKAKNAALLYAGQELFFRLFR